MADSTQITGKLTFLGTGTSTGVPLIGCDCEVCRSADPRDRRLRCSALIETQGLRILIDCGPDFRQQALRHHISHLDAVLITHNHFDHLYGLDDVRPLGNMPVYGDSTVLSTIHAFMPYCFGEHKYPGSATIELHELHPLEPFTLHISHFTSHISHLTSHISLLTSHISHLTSHISHLQVIPLPVVHGRFSILGYRFGPLAYITDASALSEEAFAALQGVRTLVINALRMTPHPSHFSLSESIEAARRIGADNTWFIHFSHHIGLHATTEPTLPAGMHMAYDNLQILW